MKRNLSLLLIFLALLRHGHSNEGQCHYTPPAGPRISCGLNSLVEIDYLLWAARQDGMAFVRSGINPDQNSREGSYHHPNWDLTSGFKVGLGRNLTYDDWDISARYTFFYGRTATEKKRQKPNDGKQSYPTWNPGDTLSIESGWLMPLQEARSQWKLHFNVVDVEIARSFFVSHFLSLRPSVGVKGTWQSQDYLIHYTAQEDPLYRIKVNQNFWGVGLRFGLDNNFHLTKFWTLFGNMYLSGLWGEFNVHRKDTERQDIGFPEQAIWDLRNCFYTLKPVFETYVGLRYDHWFKYNRSHLAMQAGWEQQLWFSQNQFIRSTEPGAHGDLQFSGLTIRLRLDF